MISSSRKTTLKQIKGLSLIANKCSRRSDSIKNKPKTTIKRVVRKVSSSKAKPSRF